MDLLYWVSLYFSLFYDSLNFKVTRQCFHLIVCGFLGDKEHHKPVLHPAMPLHLLVFICFLFGPFKLVADVISLIRNSIPKLSNMSIMELFFLAAIIMIISTGLLYGCRDHEFLLADNRCVYVSNILMF